MKKKAPRHRAYSIASLSPPLPCRGGGGGDSAAQSAWRLPHLAFPAGRWRVSWLPSRSCWWWAIVPGGIARYFLCRPSRTEFIAMLKSSSRVTLGVFQQPLTLILPQKYRDTNGSRIVIQIGGVYTTFCQEKGILWQKYAIEMGDVSRYFSKVSGSGVDLTLLSVSSTLACRATRQRPRAAAQGAALPRCSKTTGPGDHAFVKPGGRAIGPTLSHFCLGEAIGRDRFTISLADFS